MDKTWIHSRSDDGFVVVASLLSFWGTTLLNHNRLKVLCETLRLSGRLRYSVFTPVDWGGG
jgi:hypothetical protein